MTVLPKRLIVLIMAVAGVALAGPARADSSAPVVTNTSSLAPGVDFSTFQYATASGTATGDLLTVDLADPHVSVGLLHPPAVGAREQVSAMTAEAGAIAGVNADFFNISEEHPGVTPTGSSDGPEIADGQALKAAVPNSQRFGPGLAPGTSTRDVIGVGAEGRARLDTLHLAGTVITNQGHFELAGLNQYAVTQNGIDAFTSAWGDVSRERAVCGSDTSRAAACISDTAEVTVAGGRVTAVSATPGAGPIAPHSVVLVGREGGAAELRELQVGDPVEVTDRLVGERLVPFRFAVGGAPILRDGATISGVNTTTAAIRAGGGVSADGQLLYLVVLDATGPGITLADLATLLHDFGADDGVNLDGGGSSTCAVRLAGSTDVTVVNAHPSGVAERAVANGIGVFAKTP